MRFLAPLLMLLAGCGSIGVTVHNDTDQAVQVDGVGGKSITVAAGERVRVDGLRSVGEFVAQDPGGAEVARVTPGAPPRGGEVVWSLGGTVCYAEADYAAYYSVDPMVMGGVEVLGSLDPGQSIYVSKGAIDAPPGGTLPKRARGKAVALVEVPCQAKREGDAILRSWLEVALRDIQPPM